MNKTAFLTMDVESFCDISCLREKPRAEYDDFRIEHAIDDFLDLLDRYNIKATFFVLCSSLEHTEKYLTRAVKGGHEIALHGLTHEIPAQMDINELKRQIIAGKALLESKLDTEVIGYRAPCFAATDEVLNLIGELGFEYDSSCLDIDMNYYRAAANIDGFKKASCNGIGRNGGIYEIPPCKAKTICGPMSISGGGYLRLAPYSLVYGGIKKFVKTSDYYVFYCHPSDIFTEKTPKLKGISPFQAYFIKAGRKKFLSRTENIIKMLIDGGYTFSTMRDFVRSENQ